MYIHSDNDCEMVYNILNISVMELAGKRLHYIFSKSLEDFDSNDNSVRAMAQTMDPRPPTNLTDLQRASPANVFGNPR